jgi:DegV family protein with EDD domain
MVDMEGGNMSRVAIVTDSSTCLPPELIKEYGIKVAPLSLTIDGKSYRDQVDISAAEFWSTFSKIKQCSTGGPLTGDYVKIFREAAKETNEIVCIVLSQALSVTYQAALPAIKMVKAENPNLHIELVDTKTVIGALGFIVLEATRAAGKGVDMSGILQVVQNMMDRVKWTVGLLTTQTQKFGRVDQSTFSEITPQVIPLIAMLHGTGKVETIGRAQGKEDCFQKLMDIAEQNVDRSKPLHAMVHYTTSLEDGQKLLNMVKAKFNCVESYLTPYSPVLGASSGPAIALAFYV